MKKQDFYIGQRVHHPEYGDGTVNDLSKTHPFIHWDDSSKFYIDELEQHYCTPLDPEYKYGEEVEVSDTGVWNKDSPKYRYGFMDPDGIHHWLIGITGCVMIKCKHVRRPVKEPTPLTPREKLMNEIAISFNAGDSLTEIMIHVDNYVKRTLTEARETWEKENRQLIWPTLDDVMLAPGKNSAESLNWLATDAGQQWLKARKEGGK